MRRRGTNEQPRHRTARETPAARSPASSLDSTRIRNLSCELSYPQHLSSSRDLLDGHNTLTLMEVTGGFTRYSSRPRSTFTPSHARIYPSAVILPRPPSTFPQSLRRNPSKEPICKVLAIPDEYVSRQRLGSVLSINVAQARDACGGPVAPCQCTGCLLVLERG